MSKRCAGFQITKDNSDDEKNTAANSAEDESRVATSEEISHRKISRPRAPSRRADKSFVGLFSNLPKLEQKTLTRPSHVPTPAQTTREFVVSQKDSSAHTFNNTMKELNCSFLESLKQALEINSSVDLSPLFQQYKNFLDELQRPAEVAKVFKREKPIVVDEKSENMIKSSLFGPNEPSQPNPLTFPVISDESIANPSILQKSTINPLFPPVLSENLSNPLTAPAFSSIPPSIQLTESSNEPSKVAENIFEPKSFTFERQEGPTKKPDEPVIIEKQASKVVKPEKPLFLFESAKNTNFGSIFTANSNKLGEMKPFTFPTTIPTTNPLDVPKFSFGAASTATPFSFPAVSPPTNLSFAVPNLPFNTPTFSFNTQKIAKKDDSGDEIPAEETESFSNVRTNTELIKTGEGEENETTIKEVRCKIFQLDKVEGWIDLGVGIFKINRYSNEKSKSRILCRSEGSGKVLINTAIIPGGLAECTCTEGKKEVGMLLMGSDGKPVKYLVRVKTSDEALDLKSSFEDELHYINETKECK